MMIQVPGPIKYLFDTFPLKTYPAVPQHSSDEELQIENRLFAYSSPSSSSSHFKLGVYNVIQTDQTTYIATDPLCLTAELALSLQNDIKLPKFNNNHHISNNSLFLLSHNSNKQGQLPIYIEQDNKSGKRIVKDHQSLNELYCSKIESSVELMLITLCDCVLYDFWTSVVLLNLNREEQSEIYQFNDGTEGSKLTNKLSLPSLLNNLCYRNGFNFRNPNITKNSDFNLFVSKESVQKEQGRILKEFKKTIEDLNNILLKKGTNFFNGDGPGLLDVKLSSYLILINKFFKKEERELIDSYPLLIKHSNDVLKVCMLVGYRDT